MIIVIAFYGTMILLCMFMSNNPESLKKELKQQIVNALNLKHITPEEIEDDEPLFGEGIGLDSVDAIELIILLERNYGVKVRDPKEGAQVFQSVQSMAEFIAKEKASAL